MSSEVDEWKRRRRPRHSFEGSPVDIAPRHWHQAIDERKKVTHRDEAKVVLQSRGSARLKGGAMPRGKWATGCARCVSGCPPVEAMLECVRRYAAYLLNRENLERTMVERRVVVDHTTAHQ